MAERMNRARVPGEDREAAGDPSRPVETPHPHDSGLHRPTPMLRRLLGRGAVRAEREGTASAPATPGSRAPGVLPLVGATLVVGVAAGFLELAAVFGQLQGLHQVRWSSLRISRHAAWMIPVAETLLVAGWTLALVAPVLAWAAWKTRKRGGPGEGRLVVAWAWNWSGAVLGTFLIFGPLLTVPGLHPVAVVVLAIGLGYRIRGWLVRPTAAWQRVSCWAGALALVMLATYSLVQESRVAAAPDRAWSRPLAAAAAGKPAPNLLWIVMDTVRADHLSLYGYGRETTPELEALAKEGITFDMARSAAPWTLPSHMTMFTGLWPYQHGARVDRPYFGPSPMLAEHLNAHGYTTAGIVANVRVCNSGYGFGRGFDYYVDYPRNQTVDLNETICNSTLGAWTMNLLRRARLPVPGESPYFVHRPANEIVSDAKQWLDHVRSRNETDAPDAPRPFFLFLNFMDVHGPYLPSPASRRKFWTKPVPEQSLASPNGGWLAVRARNAAPPEQRPQRQQELDAVTQRLTDLYDECLHGLDAELGRFLRELRAGGKLENTWVVITGDHGEHLGEHGHFGHGSSLYNELTHVPLLIIPPPGADGAGRGEPATSLRNRRIGAPVAHRDLPRTFGDLLLPQVKNPFPGRSLARHWDSAEPQSPDPILAQLDKQPLDGQEVQTEKVITMDSVIDEDHVMIDLSINQSELYHLFNDRNQERNLADQVSERARRARLKRTLDSLLSNPEAATP